MRMNSTCYKQYDTRWSGLPYPRKPWYIRNCGCGEVAICNAIIEMATQAGQTPKTIQPYMKQYAESRGNGTYHYGIPAAMKHYGLTEVAEHATMQKLWNELKKGGRVAILLMGKRNAGSKGVHWTGSGHFVAVTGYKEEGGKHWVYVKDSASTSSLRNGWITYEGNIRNACLKCWSGKLNGAAAKTPAPTFTATADGKLTIDGVGGPSTVKAMQRFFGTPQDGIISGQNQSCAKWYPALKSVKYGKGGSPCIRNLQRWVSVSIDGVWGKNTSIALQKKLGVTADGIFGMGSMKAWQKYLNEHDKAVYPPTPSPTPTPKPAAKTQGDKIADSAKSYIGKVKYVKGGTSLKTGCDCTGFVQAIHKLHGITLDVRKTWGKSVGKDISKAKRGDVIYYYKNGKLHHMGIYNGNGKIIHNSTSHKDWHKDVCEDNVKRPGMTIGDIRRCWK